MAYDVDRRPGTWVTARARRRSQRVWAVIGLFRRARPETAGQPRGRWRNSLAQGSSGGDVGRRGAERAPPRGLHGSPRRRAGGRGERRPPRQRPHRGLPRRDEVPRLREAGSRFKAKRQAAKLHAELGAWITPVICLHVREGRACKHEGVWIVPQHLLLEWIRGQRNAVLPFARLARFADGL